MRSISGTIDRQYRTPAPETRTPADVHYHLAAAKATKRADTLATARARSPERFSTSTDPKILAPPSIAWINNPNEKTKQKLAA